MTALTRLKLRWFCFGIKYNSYSTISSCNSLDLSDCSSLEGMSAALSIDLNILFPIITATIKTAMLK